MSDDRLDAKCDVNIARSGNVTDQSGDMTGQSAALSAGRVWLGNPPVSVAHAVENTVGVESDGAENMGPRSPPPSPVLAVPAALSPVHTGSGDW